MSASCRRPQSAWDLLADIGCGVLSIFKGHWITLKNLFRKKVTDQYPHRHHPEREWHPQPGYRGDFALISDAERPGGLRCIACLACANMCPDKCIHIRGAGKGKERHPEAFFIDIGKCMYCWLCVEVCPVAAITMTRDYHNVVYEPGKLIRDLEDLRARGEDIPEPEVPVAPELTTLQSAQKKKSKDAS
jgi:formate hydrogenlyase subunit 6/NADH:ubiquinone oxidoreductase subunit I